MRINSQTVVIRADASISNGTGHIMRCLALAERLRASKIEVMFICRATPGNLIAYIESLGFKTMKIDFGSELPIHMEEEIQLIKSVIACFSHIIIDHYFADFRYEEALINDSKVKVVVIDDLANRRHTCHFLLDQNPYIDAQKRYVDLVPSDCTMLLGGDFCLLRKEFKELRSCSKIRNHPIRKILILFGGSDPTNETKKAIAAVDMVYSSSIHLDVVVGSSNENKSEIEAICSQRLNTSFYCQTNRIGELMVNADLSIGAGGSTSWERCCLGLPSITAVLADNQSQVGRDLAKYGAVYLMDNNFLFTISDYTQALLAIAKMDLAEMSYASFKLIDGMGTERVFQKIFNH